MLKKGKFNGDAPPPSGLFFFYQKLLFVTVIEIILNIDLENQI